jgi:hypothetical protein
MDLWMIVGGLFWLAALGLLIWALVRWLGSRPQTPPPGPSALEILRQRYARGEIGTATFEHGSLKRFGPSGQVEQSNRDARRQEVRSAFVAVYMRYERARDVDWSMH